MFTPFLKLLFKYSLELVMYVAPFAHTLEGDKVLLTKFPELSLGETIHLVVVGIPNI